MRNEITIDQSTLFHNPNKKDEEWKGDGPTHSSSQAELWMLVPAGPTNVSANQILDRTSAPLPLIPPKIAND